MIILGAGLAGCLAGALERDADIYEASAAVSAQHKAVLRFRDDKVSRALGIPFKRVRVGKSIWSDGRSYNWCSPRDANLYSQKVIGRFAARSIQSLDTVDRFIAPDNLHGILAERCESRIHWGARVTGITKETLYISSPAMGNCAALDRKDEPIVSTMPLNTLHKICSMPLEDQFNFAPIHVHRYRVPGSDVYQTVYFPDAHLGIYRATLSGELFILEGAQPIEVEDIESAEKALGLCPNDVQELESAASQQYGKIDPLPDLRRKKLLLDFTMRFNIFALGRFATWRNILLDDVAEDLFKIRAMVAMGTYDILRVNAGE